MAKKKKSKETEAGTLGRLSKAGEDALTRLVEELGKNERVTDALGRATAAKGKLDEGAKRAVGQVVGLAAAEELKDLRKHIERLEKRLAKLETDGKAAPKPRDDEAPGEATTARAPSAGRSIGGRTQPRRRLARHPPPSPARAAGARPGRPRTRRASFPGCSPSSTTGSGRAVSISTACPGRPQLLGAARTCRGRSSGASCTNSTLVTSPITTTSKSPSSGSASGARRIPPAA